MLLCYFTLPLYHISSKRTSGFYLLRENFTLGSKRGRIVNGAGLYLLLASFFVNNVTSINLHTTGLQAASSAWYCIVAERRTVVGGATVSSQLFSYPVFSSSLSCEIVDQCPVTQHQLAACISICAWTVCAATADMEFNAEFHGVQPS